MTETLVKEARERMEAAWTQDQENRDDANLDLRYAAGDQWPSKARQEREADDRPCITVNRFPQFIHQVANDIRSNPPGVRATPVDDKTDPELAKIYSGLIRDIEYRSDAASVYAMAGGHAVLCGIGHFRVTTQYVHDETFDQEIIIKRIPHPLSVFWDPDAILPDRSDANFCLVSQLMHVEAFKKKYPKVTPVGFDLPTSTNSAENGLFWRNGDFIRIAEYWYKVPVTKKIVLLEDGRVIDVTSMQASMLSGLPVKAEREVKTHKFQSVLLTQTDILEEPQEWAGRHIPIIPAVGGEIPLDTKIVRYGLVRFARDPQQLYNYARSSAAEVLGQAPKAPFLATPKQIAKYKAQWDSHNTTRRPYLLYEPDERVPGGMPQRSAPPAIPTAYIQESQIAIEDMKATTGIYDASLGNRSNETSGKAIIARERQGDTANAHYSDNLNASIRHCGRIIVDLIPKIYDTERIVRILGEDESEKFVSVNKPVYSDNGEPTLMNDLSVGRYDIRMRVGPSYATQRLEAADAMLQFVQAVPQAAALIGDLIATNMDWPGADEIAARLKRAVPANILGPEAVDKDDPEAQQQAQQNAQAAQKMQQMQELAAKLELMLKEAEVEKKRSDARKASAAAQSEKHDTWIKSLQTGVQPPPCGFDEDEAAAQDMLGGGEQQQQPMQPQGQPQQPMPANGEPATMGEDLSPEQIEQLTQLLGSGGQVGGSGEAM